MKKNPTPQQIAFATAGMQTLALIVLLLLTQLVWRFHLSSTTIVIVILAIILVFSFNYIITLNALKNFIYRKIKTIYKSIHNLKQPKGKVYKETSMNEDIIGKVEQEVSEWTTDTNFEIQELKKNENFRKEFLGNVSHELKTPVFAIQGYVQTLIDGGLNDESINLKYLNNADKNVDRLISILDDLDVISRHESGQMVINNEEFDIVDLTLETIDLNIIKAQKKGITVGIKKGFSNSIMVNADREKIQQVLTNLIINSIKYGKESGKTSIGFYDMHNYILVEVSDNGIGIPKELLPRLFERFFRIDKSRSRNAGGTGLGLSIVKHIVEAHNQTINVRSTLGVGSTFGFTIQKA